MIRRSYLFEHKMCCGKNGRRKAETGLRQNGLCTLLPQLHTRPCYSRVPLLAGERFAIARAGRSDGNNDEIWNEKKLHSVEGAKGERESPCDDQRKPATSQIAAAPRTSTYVRARFFGGRLFWSWPGGCIMTWKFAYKRRLINNGTEIDFSNLQVLKSLCL